VQRVLILAEGQTEELFVKQVLGHHLQSFNVFPEVTIIPSRVVPDGPNIKGGIARYEKIKNILQQLLKDSNATLITTLLDYYALPKDFPKPVSGSCYDKVQKLEAKIKQDFNDSRLYPYFCLHEFESMVFVDLNELTQATNSIQLLPQLQLIKTSYSSPEEINDHPDTAPSRRIKQLIPSYRKIAHGLSIIKNVGLDAIRAECPHFNEWLTKLESVGQAPS